MCWNFTYADGDREKEDKVVVKLKRMCLNCRSGDKCDSNGCLRWRKEAYKMRSICRMFDLLKLLRQLKKI